MCFVYIIASLKDGSFYIGRTADLKERLNWHNSEALNQGITKRKIPWNYLFTLEVENAKIAGKIENHIKRMKSREYIRNLVKYPEISERLIEKYS